MKLIYRIILFALICWFGYRAFLQTLEPQRKELLYVLQHYNLIILIFLSIAAIVFDIAAYRVYPKFFQFYTSTAAIFLCTIVVLRLFTYSNIEKSKTLFKAMPKNGHKNIVEMQFKENDYLVMRDLSSQVPFIYFGRYIRNIDTITITQTNYDSFSNTLPVSGIIYNGQLLWRNGDTMLLETPN
jgi:hypothetical protein